MDFNEKLKEISIIQVGIIFIVGIFILVFLDSIFGIDTPSDLIYIFIIVYIAYRLRKCKSSFKYEISHVFDDVSFKWILWIVILNIFFSYGMIYLTDIFVGSFSVLPAVGSMGILESLVYVVIIAPIFEELVFRGVILNRLSRYVSITIAIVVSSILFGISHDFGGIFSAFIFGICMCILYLRTSNIFVPMAAHFINNILSETIYYLDFNDLIFTNDLVIVIISILAIVSFFLLLKSILRELKQLKSNH